MIFSCEEPGLTVTWWTGILFGGDFGMEFLELGGFLVKFGEFGFFWNIFDTGLHEIAKNADEDERTNKG